MKVYCFGNEYIKEDALAIELASILKINDIEFIKCDSIEPILEEKGTIYIMDVVKGINEITLINDINLLKNRKCVSCHDFDLQFFLKLLKEMDRIKDVVIIGLPMKGEEEKIVNEVKELIEKVKAS